MVLEINLHINYNGYNCVFHINFILIWKIDSKLTSFLNKSNIFVHFGGMISFLNFFLISKIGKLVWFKNI